MKFNCDFAISNFLGLSMIVSNKLEQHEIHMGVFFNVTGRDNIVMSVLLFSVGL